MGVLDLEALAATPLTREPFEFVVVPEFVKAEARAAIERDFPAVGSAGSHPVETVPCGPAFQALVDELNGEAMREAFQAKFGIDLAGRATMMTVRNHSSTRDGSIHTDSKTKIITVLIYLNTSWTEPNGRLRLLGSGHDLDDTLAEIAPEKGALVAFRRSDNSWHGHTPFIGERRVLQFNWVTTPDVARRELARHGWTAKVKRLMAIAHR